MKFVIIVDCDDVFFDEMFVINVKGIFNVCCEVVKWVCDGGCIINLLISVIGMCMLIYGVYVVSKVVVESFM